MGAIVTRQQDVIDIQSYQAGYAGGYSEGLNGGYEIGYVACWMDIRREAAAKRELQNYIRKQRAYGALVLGLTAVVTVVCADLTFACFGIPIGLGLIFVKRRCLA
ncbi:MAG: hypothetical protein LIP10_03610 [Clostridiales bacterium]|nr:hypothetical protein [Clostridiales bacterium]